MKPSIEKLLQLQKEYDQLSEIWDLIQRLNDKFTNEDAPQILLDQVQKWIRSL
jgi:hypothetical protein